MSRARAIDLKAFTSPGRVLFLPPDTGKASALRELAIATAAHPAVTDGKAFCAAIFDRERVSSTGIGAGIAVPHAKLPSIDDFVISLGISRTGIDFQAKDSAPVHLLVMIAASDRAREAYLKVLAAVACRLKDPQVRDAMRAAGDAQAVCRAFLGEKAGVI